MILKKKILVIGDVMLDRYWMGQVNRISPEAPVPILDVDTSVDKPGGAANVAKNLSDFGMDVTLIGLTGEDEASEIVRNLSPKEVLDLSKDPRTKTAASVAVFEQFYFNTFFHSQSQSQSHADGNGSLELGHELMISSILCGAINTGMFNRDADGGNNPKSQQHAQPWSLLQFLHGS